jgi:hypothetical protein
MKYVLVVVGVVMALFILLLVALNRGGSPQQALSKPVVLSEQANASTSVRMTMQGRLVGETERRAVAITISDTERRFEILSGFNETVIRTETFSNTAAGYETFLLALGQAGFSKDRESNLPDERGACPLGRRFVYELLHEDNKNTFRTWDTTCNNAPGTFGGESRVIRNLFQAQIPEYHKLLRGTRF